MHAFVTGGGGFVANHLVRDLLSRGHRVTVLVRGQAPPNAPPGARFAMGDLVRARGPIVPKDADVVFHLAGISDVARSLGAPRETFAVNAMGTARLLEDLRGRERPLTRFVLASTAQVYGPPFAGRLREEHPTMPRNPYAASKLAAEGVAMAFDDLYGLPVTALRFFNVYGPGQRESFVVPSVLAQCLAGGALRIGNPWPVRDFLFVDDVVALLRAAGQDRRGRRLVVNAGTGRGVSVERMVAAAIRVTGARVKPQVEARRTRSNDFDRLVADPRLAKQRFGWTAATTLDTGLRATARALRGSWAG